MLHWIPEHLLASIAAVESGRYHQALGLQLPWPWVIKLDGNNLYFDTKEEAIAAAQRLEAKKEPNISIGCMLVNISLHPNAFANLEQAFDPAYNVAFAAQEMKANFEVEHSWRKATADYHSKDPKEGEAYADRVYEAWGKIVNKVEDARAGKPILEEHSNITPKTTEQAVQRCVGIVHGTTAQDQFASGFYKHFDAFYNPASGKVENNAYRVGDKDPLFIFNKCMVKEGFPLQ